METIKIPLTRRKEKFPIPRKPQVKEPEVYFKELEKKIFRSSDDYEEELKQKVRENRRSYGKGYF